MDSRKPFFVGITGPSGSGKSTLSDNIVAKLRAEGMQVSYIRADHYYKSVTHLDSDAIMRYNFDEPSALDMEGLYHDLKTISEGNKITRRLYEYAVTANEEKGDILPHPIILVDGLFLLADERIRTLFSVLILIDTPLDLCNTRRFLRDQQKWRSCDKALQSYATQIRPAVFKYVLDLRVHAHLSLENETEDQQKKSIEKGVAHIKNEFEKRTPLNPTWRKVLGASPLILGLGFFAARCMLSSNNSGPEPSALIPKCNFGFEPL